MKSTNTILLLANALSTFVTEYTTSLARILTACENSGQVTFEQAEELIENGDEIEEVLLSAYEWRVLVPRRSDKTLQWNDRIFIPRPGEVFESPLVVRKLVKLARSTGKWVPVKAAGELAKEMCLEPRDRVAKVVELLIEQRKTGLVDGFQIKQICRLSGLKGQEDTVISNFKAAGILSPALGYLPGVKRQTGPRYELNPSLLVPRIE